MQQAFVVFLANVFDGIHLLEMRKANTFLVILPDAKNCQFEVMLIFVHTIPHFSLHTHEHDDGTRCLNFVLALPT